MNSEHLVIIDFSGTLSIDAVLFSLDDELTEALCDSGLWQLGLNSLNMFWQDVIAPTWAAGATSTIGYAGTLIKALKQRLHCSEEELRRSVSVFAANYFAHSTIHPAWKPILQQLCVDPAIKLVVATDHYAEATELIRVQLAALGISGALIANSADIGAFKAERAFWEHVRAQLANQQFNRISVIDDFGANESQRDSYAAEVKIAKRQTEMTALIIEIFRCPVKVFPFIGKGNEFRACCNLNSFPSSIRCYSYDEEFTGCVTRAAAFLMR
ncbi:hypothetical protein U14_03487 [Candidatus Moduliflexus flocculans]|uniref:Haloacid dehalogenase domain protein hydrolase n=1 Tax=Candidatus Moduliflexus flocculans TaxID=1499966 RepID=A0A081BPC0_9BACT|nr:hypothetical protein U14_03487 [Candidatus Moduliflexus flocculans]